MTAVYLIDAAMGFLLLVYCGFLAYLIRSSCNARKREDHAKSYYTNLHLNNLDESSQPKCIWDRFDQYLKNPGDSKN